MFYTEFLLLSLFLTHTHMFRASATHAMRKLQCDIVSHLAFSDHSRSFARRFLSRQVPCRCQSQGHSDRNSCVRSDICVAYVRANIYRREFSTTSYTVHCERGRYTV